MVFAELIEGDGVGLLPMDNRLLRVGRIKASLVTLSVGLCMLIRIASKNFSLVCSFVCPITEKEFSISLFVGLRPCLCVI